MATRKRGQAELNIQGNVSIQNGDLVAGDKTITVQNGATYVDGNLSDSNLIVGSQNAIGSLTNIRIDPFDIIIKKIEARPQTSPEDKEDLKANTLEIKDEANKGDQARESFLKTRLRNIARIAPDIAEIVVALIASPTSGFAMIVRKVAEKAATQTKTETKTETTG